MTSNKNTKKKIWFLATIIITLMLSVTGATYAYFALTVSNNSVTGTAGGAGVTLAVNKVVPSQTVTRMTPQQESVLDQAISSENGCLDGDGDVICQVYKVTITNNANAHARLTGFISFQYTTSSSYTVEEQLPNLKWRRLENATTLGEYNTYQATSTEEIFEDSRLFATNESATYYFVVWINELGAAQTDIGNFRVNINFKDVDDGGHTSTIRPKYLSTAEVGSYIAYTGNNGCPEGHCDGTNANYVDDTNMGFCSSSFYKFTVNGWRVMAKDEGGVYIVSAGAPECMCTNSDGTISNSSCSSSISSNNMNLHINNLRNQAIKYCNPLYAKGGICNEFTAWAMKQSDFQKITGSTFGGCTTSSEACGLNNTLIDNGSFYWYAVRYLVGSAYGWGPANLDVGGNSYSSTAYGVRPVLYLESDILIITGSGTYEDPYQLRTPERVSSEKVLSDLEVGSYIAYTGNNGCPEDHCDGTNANYVDDTNMGYCSNSSNKFITNGWRIMAKDSGGVYLISAGAPECMCTNANGTSSNDSCSTAVSSSNVNLHFNNLNNQAIKYCNPLYAKDGVCNTSTAWAMADADYQKIIGSMLSTCYLSLSELCGSNNILIENGGYYWYATQHMGQNLYAWNPTSSYASGIGSNRVYGVRPVLYLESNISIVGGNGTYEEPFQLSNS